MTLSAAIKSLHALGGEQDPACLSFPFSFSIFFGSGFPREHSRVSCPPMLVLGIPANLSYTDCFLVLVFMMVFAKATEEEC